MPRKTLIKPVYVSVDGLNPPKVYRHLKTFCECLGLSYSTYSKKQFPLQIKNETIHKVMTTIATFDYKEINILTSTVNFKTDNSFELDFKLSYNGKSKSFKAITSDKEAVNKALTVTDKNKKNIALFDIVKDQLKKDINAWI